ncbi:hypothetical protein ACQJBY_037549 [Aegilops geniculata]
MLVLNSPSSRRLMCRVTDLFTAAGYSPANACNGFLLLAPRIHGWPLCVCNPVTGDKLLLSEAPSVQHEVSYALGFSPSTRRYKLFRLSFPPNNGCCYMDVRTLGSGGGDQLWRRYPDPLQCRAVSAPSPALVDGKIYLTCGEGILAMDVATEAHCTYPLPMDQGEKLAFELRGRLCVAVHVIAQRKLYFWVLHLDQDKKDGTAPLLDWELRYTFHMVHGGDNNDGEEQLRGAGFNDRDGMLCYRMSDRLFRYNTTKNDDHHHKADALLEWDNITQLPNKDWWNVYGGYRPTLVSPRTLLVDPLAEHRHKEFEDSLLAALRDP